MNDHPRMRRERKTIKIMIHLYCHDHHGTKGDDLCPACQELQDYALMRLDRCPFQEGKTTCANCPVHCYKPEMRKRIAEVMRYAGPKMVLRHPVLAFWHLVIDGMRKEPRRPVKGRGKGTG